MPAIATQTYDSHPEIFAAEEGKRAPRNVTIDPAQMTADSQGQKYIRAGEFVQEVTPGADTYRPLAEDAAAAATSISEDVVTFKREPFFLKVGDVLEVSGGTVGTIASIDVDAKTATLAANATTAVAADERVFVAGTGTVLGMVGHDTDVASPQGVAQDIVALFTSASVWRGLIPYVTSTLESAFPEITYVPK